MFKWLLYLSILTATISCRKDAVSADGEGTSPLYQKASFPVGVAVDIEKLKTNPNYRNLVVQQFNSLTAENAFKFDFIHPRPDDFEWSSTDYLVDFATENHKRLHGHTLIWHNQLPSWVESYSGNWDTLLKRHITAIVSRYKKTVLSWDVVNEAVNEDGTLRSTVWLQHIGPSYIRKAFEYAHKANPQATLFYNDYNLEGNPRKLTAVLQLCSDLKAEGVPIDGIGMQMHISYNYPSATDIQQAADRVAQAGFKLHFSELDVIVNFTGNKDSFTVKDLKLQAERYQTVAGIYSNLQKNTQFGITFWGVSDADSWIPFALGHKDMPLLFDAQYQPKPAYYSFKKGLR